MVKKIRIKVDFSEDNFLFGVSCHKPEYWMAFTLNKVFHLNLERIPDLSVFHEKLEVLIPYPLYYYVAAERDLSFYLFPNHHPDGKLFPSQKNTDYFVLVNGIVKEEEKQEFVKDLKKIRHILASFEIPLNKIRSLNGFLSDLELHMTEINKGKK
ncbi:MAG: IPExxxVDY family protein [Chlorobi bacterium]|nr:IPExxxVDY family protein [Chlorobiota bacterium]